MALETKKMRRASDMNLEPMFVRMSLTDEGEQRLLHKALRMTAELLTEYFSERVETAVVLYRAYDAVERVLPLAIQAEFASDEEYYQLEKALADQIFGPVFRETRVTLPVEISHAVDRPSGRVGLIFPMEN